MAGLEGRQPIFCCPQATLVVPNLDLQELLGILGPLSLAAERLLDQLIEQEPDHPQAACTVLVLVHDAVDATGRVALLLAVVRAVHIDGDPPAQVSERLLLSPRIQAGRQHAALATDFQQLGAGQ